LFINKDFSLPAVHCRKNARLSCIAAYHPAIRLHWFADTGAAKNLSKPNRKAPAAQAMGGASLGLGRRRAPGKRKRRSSLLG
jgi:hypothetical protein